MTLESNLPDNEIRLIVSHQPSSSVHPRKLDVAGCSRCVPLLYLDKHWRILPSCFQTPLALL